jgi:hypothetical protein
MDGWMGWMAGWVGWLDGRYVLCEECEEECSFSSLALCDSPAGSWGRGGALAYGE